MANATKEPRDLSKVWDAPLRCRGARMTKDQILERLNAELEKVDDDSPAAERAQELTKLVKNAGGDVQAQRVLYEAGIPYLSGCGVDLRDQQHDLLAEHGRGVSIDYECEACGASHTVKFGAEPEEE